MTSTNIRSISIIKKESFQTLWLSHFIPRPKWHCVYFQFLLLLQFMSVLTFAVMTRRKCVLGYSVGQSVLVHCYQPLILCCRYKFSWLNTILANLPIFFFREDNTSVFFLLLLLLFTLFSARVSALLREGRSRSIGAGVFTWRYGAWGRCAYKWWTLVDLFSKIVHCRCWS